MQTTENNIKKKKIFLPRFGIGKEADSFLENLSSLLSAGIPILDALESIGLEMRSRKLRGIIANMEDDIRDGNSLSTALEHSGLFPSRVCALIRIGEESGKLIENLKIIVTEERKRQLLRSKVRSAIMYPAFVLNLTLIIGTGIAWFILPKLAVVFSQLKISLPTVTKILIAFGNFLSEYGAYAVPSFFALLGLLLYFLFFFSKTKIAGEYILFSLPGSKTLLQETEMSRFGYLLGTHLSAGLSLVESVRSLAEATSLVRYRRFYLYLAEKILEGNSFKKSFASYEHLNRLVPVSVQQLVVAGEQSGSLSNTLLTISETYEAKTDATAKDLTVMLEPILLLIVWLGVLAVAFAVILPIYSLVGGLNTDPQQSVETPSSEVVIPETTVPTATPLTEVTPVSVEGASVPLLPLTLQILPTGTGYLNVRSEPAQTGRKVAKVLPDEVYVYTNEKGGWYEITLSNGESGWVSGQYITLTVYEKKQ